MSGDCRNQPVIFYTKEMTLAKMILLSENGVKFEIEELKKELTRVEGLSIILDSNLSLLCLVDRIISMMRIKKHRTH